MANANSEASIWASPLRIIAQFIFLSEALALAGAAVTDGTTRLILAIFGVSFPILVLAVFVWLLVRHTEKLYSPGEYTETTTVETFYAIMNRSRLAFESTLLDAVPRAVASAQIPAVRAESQLQAANALEDALNERTISIQIGDDPNEDPVRIPVTDKTTVQDLLDQTYFQLAPQVDAYTYGSQWELTRDSGERLPVLGSSDDGNWPDLRTLSSVGITPEVALEVVRL